MREQPLVQAGVLGRGHVVGRGRAVLVDPHIECHSETLCHLATDDAREALIRRLIEALGIRLGCLTLALRVTLLLGQHRAPLVLRHERVLQQWHEILGRHVNLVDPVVHPPTGRVPAFAV